MKFFAERSERDIFALSIIAAAFLFPFTITNFVQGRPLLGVIIVALVVWFVVHGIAAYRGRRLVPPAVVFLPALGVLCAALAARGDLAIFWSYPAVLLFHFILNRRVANLFNATVVAMTVPFAYANFGPDIALRVAATLVLTIVFANVFSYLMERNERALKLERDRLALLVHATQAGFADWDAASNKVIYSERFKEILGYARDADTSAWPPYFELLHPEDRAQAEASFRALLRRMRTPGMQAPSEPLDYRLRRADGSYVWVHAQGLAQVDEAGKRIARLITSIQDTTLLREQERTLGDQAKFAADVFDSLSIGLAMRDLEGRYVFVNRAWENYTGARREDVIGKTVYERATQAEADAVIAADRNVLARGAGAAQDLQDFAFRGKRFILTRTVMADAQGAVRGVLVASVDVTDRYAMEEALSTEQRRFELVVRAARVGIVDWDGRTHETYYSPRFREIRGYAPDADTTGWPDYFKEMIHPDDRERVTRRFRDYIMGKGPHGMLEFYDQEEYQLSRADGGYVWVQASGICLRDANNFATRFIAVITDVTERRQQEEALRASVRLREEVERMSHHDLKTPLNSIIAVPRLLREGRKLSSEEKELLNLVERAGYRILNMVNLSLDLFRMEQGSYTFRPQAVDLEDLARKVAADLESQADSKQVEIRIKTESKDSSPVVARGEELLCYSMLANLLKNAIEASPEGGAVTVSVEGGKGALLHVHNAGEVPEAVRASFFDKYSTSGKPGGLGLGTYSALLMARVQEGNITMRTSAADGTTLSIALAEAPVGEIPAAPGAPLAGDRAPARLPQLAPLDVLVVDDDEFNRLVMRRYLPSPPLNVAMAVNGRAAIEALRRQRYDFVFLDLEMPVMSGYEAAERIRKLEREEGRKPCVLVAFSQNDDDNSIRRALAAGCDHYLIKPAPRETLWKLLAGGSVAQEKKAGKAPAFDDVVEIDLDLRPTLPAFMLSRREALDEIDASLARGQPDAAKRLAHKLAGSFSLYGFKWAATQCRSIQQAAEGGNGAALAGQVAQVREHLDAAVLRFVESADSEPAA